MAELKDDYSPYKHREVLHPISNVGALMNVVKAIVGTGILVAPTAFRDAGWLNGLISTIIIGIIVLYSKQILMYGMYDIAKRRRVPIFSYAEGVVQSIAEGPPCMRGFQGLLRFLVNFLLSVYHFGSASVYVVFIANCLKDIGDNCGIMWDTRYYMMCQVLPLGLIYCVTNMKSLVPLAMIANVSLIFGFGIIFYYIVSDLKPFEELQPVQDVRLYPLFFGATLFAFESPGLVVAVEANMRKPEAYLGLTGVLSRGIFIVFVMQLVFGFCGYWRYGDDLKPSILQSLPYDELLGNLARVIFAFSMFVTHPFQGYIPTDVIWNNWLKAKVSENKAHNIEILFRICLSTLTVLVAVAFPNLNLIISFVGAFSLSFLGLIFPVLIDISLRYETGYGPMRVYLIFGVVVIVCAIIGAVTGSYVPVDEFIKLYASGTDLTG